MNVYHPYAKVITNPISTNCISCGKNRAKKLSCGHISHMGCMHGSKCPCCSQDAVVVKGVSLSRNSIAKPFSNKKLENTTQRLTTGRNGNAFITINQRDEWGRTTIIREVVADKMNDFQKMMGTNLKLVSPTTQPDVKGFRKILPRPEWKRVETNTIQSFFHEQQKSLQEPQKDAINLGALLFNALMH